MKMCPATKAYKCSLTHPHHQHILFTAKAFEEYMTYQKRNLLLLMHSPQQYALSSTTYQQTLESHVDSCSFAGSSLVPWPLPFFSSMSWVHNTQNANNRIKQRKPGNKLASSINFTINKNSSELTIGIIKVCVCLLGFYVLFYQILKKLMVHKVCCSLTWNVFFLIP